MAEFAKWGCAISEALGFGAQTFLDDYHKATLAVTREFLEDDSFASVILAVMAQNRKPTAGTPEEVYKRIKEFTADLYIRNFPNGAASFGKALRSKEAVLSEAGIYFRNGFHKGNRCLILSHEPIDDGDIKDVGPRDGLIEFDKSESYDIDLGAYEDDAPLPF